MGNNRKWLGNITSMGHSRQNLNGELRIWTGSKILDIMLTFCIPCKLVSLVSEGWLQLMTHLIKP